MTTRLALIVARAENNVIGKDGGLPWRVSSDMKYFRKTTMGKPVIMGRKTWESLKAPLHGRDNIVVSRNSDYLAADATVVDSSAQALEIAAEYAQMRGVNEIMVIGGAQIYEAFLLSADRIYLTEIHRSYRGDAAFPENLSDHWRETSRERHAAGKNDDADYSFVVLDRRKPL